MSAPSVYAAIHAIAADLATIGIAKSQINAADDYKYRSIDDLLGGLAPLLAKHRLCVLPQVLERTERDWVIKGEGVCLHVALRVGFALTSVDDGTCHVVEAYGEALDASDKATAKAMSAAYKSAMVQTFCIPVCGGDDPEYSRKEVVVKGHMPEPVQGWQRWSGDIIEIVESCDSDRALRVVQARHRALLVSLSRERPELYTFLGQSFTSRRKELQERSASKNVSRVRSKSAGPERGSAEPLGQAVEHA